MSNSYDPLLIGQILYLSMEEVLGGDGVRSVLTAAGVPVVGVGNLVQRPAAVDGSAAGARPTETESCHFPPSELSHILATLEQLYGVPAGRGLALRIGRASFQYGLRELGGTLGLTATSFRLLPLPVKLKAFAAALAGLFNAPGDERVRFARQDGKLLWHIQRCPLCSGRHADGQVCQFSVGLAEESLYWLSGGKMFSVEETACIAQGAPACIVQVDETPLS